MNPTNTEVLNKEQVLREIDEVVSIIKNIDKNKIDFKKDWDDEVSKEYQKKLVELNKDKEKILLEIDKLKEAWLKMD